MGDEAFELQVSASKHRPKKGLLLNHVDLEEGIVFDKLGWLKSQQEDPPDCPGYLDGVRTREFRASKLLDDATGQSAPGTIIDKAKGKRPELPFIKHVPTQVQKQVADGGYQVMPVTIPGKVSHAAGSARHDFGPFWTVYTKDGEDEEDDRSDLEKVTRTIAYQAYPGSSKLYLIAHFEGKQYDLYWPFMRQLLRNLRNIHGRDFA